MVFVEGGGVEPPPRLAVLPALSTFPLGQPSFVVVPCAYPQGPSFVYFPAIPSRHPATVPVALAAVVFLSILMIPFSFPSLIILLILFFGYSHRVHFSSPSGHITDAYSLGSRCPFVSSHSWLNIPNCSSNCLGFSHTSSAPSITSCMVCLTVAMISALSILSIDPTVPTSE